LSASRTAELWKVICWSRVSPHACFFAFLCASICSASKCFSVPLISIRSIAVCQA